jgi:uncharacterized membrane protein HdeD (DUF308 family)
MASATQKMSNFDKSALIFQGVIALLFGIAAVFWPGITIVTLLYLFAAFLLVDGVVIMVRGLMSLRHIGSALLMLLLGLLELGVGVYLLRHPQVTFATFILLIGFSLIVRGVLGFVHAFTRKDDPATIRTLNGILGVLGVIVGIVILNQPVAGGVAFVWILGFYALIAGPIQMAMASDIAGNGKK